MNTEETLETIAALQAQIKALRAKSSSETLRAHYKDNRKRKHSPEHCARITASLLRYNKEHPPGPCPPERRKKLSESMRRAWKRKPRSAESNAKIAAGIKKAYAEGRHATTPKGVCYVSREGSRRHIKKAQEVSRGTMGFGTVARGCENHPTAKEWVIEDPEGNRYTITNLRGWAWTNRELLGPTPPENMHENWINFSSAMASTGGKWFDWRRVQKGADRRAEKRKGKKWKETAKGK